MGNSPFLINGGSFKDERGRLDFVNEFDLEPVKRIYFTSNAKIGVFRGWQGHKIEKRWFFCVRGSFKIQVIKIDNWDNPSNSLNIESYMVSEDKPQVLYVPNGYINGFEALKQDSKMMLMSDYAIGTAKNDEYRFESNKWREKK